MSTAEIPMDKDALRRIKGMNPPEEATPRTDAIWMSNAAYELRQLSKQLERELSEEKKLSAAISRDCNTTALERNHLRDELAQLRRQVAEGQALCTKQQDLIARLGCYLPDAMIPEWDELRHLSPQDALTSALAAERAATIERCAKDTFRLDLLQLLMTPDGNYCEIYLSGMRDFKTGQANAYQIESNPTKFSTLNRPTLRAAIDAMHDELEALGNTDGGSNE